MEYETILEAALAKCRSDAIKIRYVIQQNKNERGLVDQHRFMMLLSRIEELAISIEDEVNKLNDSP